MVTRILCVCACLMVLCCTVGLGMAQARYLGPPPSMCPPLQVQMPGPQPPCGPGVSACPGQMCGMPACPPPCPPPCMSPGCPPQNCGSSCLGGFSPLSGLLSVLTAPFRFLGNCLSLNGNCQPLPCCEPMPCAPPCMPPCPQKITKCGPHGMPPMPPPAAYGYGYPPMGQ